MNTSTLVQKLWNYCNVLRDDGMSYGDYVEQLTYLLFLKMADERSRAPHHQPSPIPQPYAWPALLALDGDALFDHYRHTLEALGRQPGTLALIFAKAQNKFQDPAKLRRVIVDLIDGENWSAMGADVKGDAYEGLLEKNAQDTKSGAGQYFTPRALIQAMVDCIAPRPGDLICDPACGTGGFLFTAHQYLTHVELKLKTPWRDGTTHLVMSPLAAHAAAAPRGCRGRGCTSFACMVFWPRTRNCVLGWCRKARPLRAPTGTEATAAGDCHCDIDTVPAGPHRG